MDTFFNWTRTCVRAGSVLTALSVWGIACSSGATPTQTMDGAEAGSDGTQASSGGSSGGLTQPTADAATANDGNDQPADGGSTRDVIAACTPARPPVTTSTQYLCSPGGSGSCDNCNDCAMVIDGTASSQVASCGTSCIGQPDSCVTQCLSSKNPTLSNTCQSCLATLFNCTTQYCAGPCVTGTQAECNQCLAANPSPGPTSCNSVFLQCAGLQNNPTYSGQ